MARRVNIPHPTLSVAVQNWHVHRYFPQFQYRRDKRCWLGWLQPTEFSPIYRVRVDYRLHTTPKVWIVSPPLQAGAKHLYG
ncbi:MAG: hypothetical protein M1546_04480, partial [Chloroflexi bacterium]|nr:hypothetical protein [Chloroflexota bacterium]